MQSKWSTVKLGEVLTERREKPDLDAILRGRMPIVAKIGFDTGEIELRKESKTRTNMILIRPGDLVISGINAAKGAIAIYREENNTPAAATIHYSSYSINKKEADTSFLWYFMRSDVFKSILKSSLPGGIKTEVKSRRLLPIEILLPSIKDQKDIVLKIKDFMVRIEKLRQLKTKAVKKAKALLESSVSAIFKSLNSVEKKKLSTLTTKIGSGSTPRGGRASYPDSGIPFIRSMNVRMRKFQWDGIAFIHETTHETMSGTKVKPNDVLFNITGASIGRVACAPPNLVEANVNQHVSIIRPIKSLNPIYLMYWLSQPLVQDMINQMQKGATRQGLTKTQIESFEVPVPSLREQIRVVAYLDSLIEKVNELKKLQDRTEKEIEKLTPSVLNKAFKGEQ